MQENNLNFVFFFLLLLFERVFSDVIDLKSRIGIPRIYFDRDVIKYNTCYKHFFNVNPLYMKRPLLI